MNSHVESRLADAQRALRRLIDTADRNGFVMLGIAARQSVSELQDAAEHERDFRASRGIQ